MSEDVSDTSRNRGATSFASAAVLLAGLLVLAGFATAAQAEMMSNDGSSHSGMTMQNEQNMMSDNAITGYHVIKGQISSVQQDSSGAPAWIESGIWVLRVDLGHNASTNMTELKSAHFIDRFAMVKPDGTALHMHNIYNFQPIGIGAQNNGATRVLNGTATVTMPGGPVDNVPITIKVFNLKVFALWIGPDKVNSHFGTGPIFGLLSPVAGSYGAMMKSQPGSMMMGNGTMGGSMMHNMTMMSSVHQNLTATNLPVRIPLTRGYENGHEIFYISTEASDKGLASLMTNWTGARVAYAPSLARTPSTALSNIYAFKNGVQGSGPLGFQPNVADSQPGDPNYSPLWRLVLVEWKNGTSPTELKSEQAIGAAASQGLVTLTPTTNVVNCPVIKWDSGSLMQRANTTLTDTSPYGHGQVLSISPDNKAVTFVAHRGFAPDGSTIYYIATDASNPDVAKALGVVYVNKTAAVTLTAAASDLYVFTNGIMGTGPMGYQASIASSNVGDALYSPMWRINAVTWHDASQAKFLTMSYQINMAASSGMLTTQIAGFVVNCPFVVIS